MTNIFFCLCNLMSTEWCPSSHSYSGAWFYSWWKIIANGWSVAQIIVFWGVDVDMSWGIWSIWIVSLLLVRRRFVMGIIILGRWWPQRNELGIVLGDILLWVMGLLGEVWIGTPSFEKILEVHSMFTINYLMLYFRGHSKSFKLKYLGQG